MKINFLTSIKDMSKKYERKNKKPYHQWVLDHRDEILALPNKDRTDYVMSKLKDELNLEMKKYNVYQLLYRNGMINHKFIQITPVATTETTVYENDSENDADERSSESESEDLVFRNEPCNFRETLCNFFGPELLEKITFVEQSREANSEDYYDSDSDY